MPTRHIERHSRREPIEVTIVISSFNQRQYLPEAITSALSQTIRSPVVVVDDGSSDGSAELAEGMGVDTVRLSHRGALETFRSGVEVVKTPFYILLNGDDALEDSYVERTLPWMTDPEVGFVYTGVRYIGAREGVEYGRPFDRAALRWWNFAHGASLVRKAAYESVGGYDLRFKDHHEDWALWVAMVAKGWAGASIGEPLLRYRQHEHETRNPRDLRAIKRLRWRLAFRYPAYYGVRGLFRLAGWSVTERLRHVS